MVERDVSRTSAHSVLPRILIRIRIRDRIGIGLGTRIRGKEMALHPVDGPEFTGGGSDTALRHGD